MLTSFTSLPVDPSFGPPPAGNTAPQLRRTWLGRLAYPQFPAVAEAWTTRQCLNYNAALDLMNSPPPGIRIRVFRPLKPMPVGPFTIAKHRIHAALTSGHDEALLQFVPAAMNQQAELSPHPVPE